MFSVTFFGMSSRPALDPALLSHLISAQRLEDRRGRRSSGIPVTERLLGGGGARGARGRALGGGGGGPVPRGALTAGSALQRLLWIRCAVGVAAKAADLVLGAG